MKKTSIIVRLLIVVGVSGITLGAVQFASAKSDGSIPKVLIIQNDSHDIGLGASTSGSSSPSGTDKSKKDQPGKAILERDPDITEPLAEFLAENSKVEPIVWSTADPLFRKAYQSDKIPWQSGPVSLDQAQAGAKVLGCQAVIYVYGHKAEVAGLKGIYFRATMVVGSKTIWVFPSADQFAKSSPNSIRVPVLVPEKAPKGDKDAKLYKSQLKYLTPKLTDQERAQLDLSNWMFMSEVTGSKADEDSAIDSISSTLTSSLNQGPFMGLKEVPALPDAPMNPGIDVFISPQLPPSDPVSDEGLAGKIAGFVKDQDQTQALTLAHNAVDENPLDPRRREILLQTLNSFGLTADAVEEAKSAAVAFGNSAPLLAVGAQIAFDGREVDQAQAMAVRALAIDAKSAQAKVVLGEVALANGDLTSGYLDSAPYATGPVPIQAWMNGLIAAALAGKLDPINLASNPQLASIPSEVSARSLWILQKEYHRQADTFRVQLGQVSMDSPDQLTSLTSQLKTQAAVITSEGALLQKLSLAFPAEKKLLRTQLAYNLLLQCTEEVSAYIANGRKGGLDDPQINFSESLRQMALAEQSESAPSHVDPPSS